MAESGTVSRRFGCPSCGGGLRYDIASGKMICDRCGGLTALRDLPPEPEDDTLEVTEFHCPQCGAAVYSTDTEVTSFCSFCGSDVVLTGKLTRTARPADILPFQVTREDCEAAYRQHLKKYLLAPADLKKAETISHFRPVYVPFWSYEVDAEGPARLEGKKSYVSGDYRYDETYDLSMDAVIRQKGILYDASSAFEDETAAMLKHTAEGARPFHPAYLSGFYAQAADVSAETYHAEAAASAVRMFMDTVREENEMDSVEMKGDVSDSFGLPNARYRERLIMLPVWLLAHRQGSRVVYTAVNGQSGEVVCDVPVSAGKVTGVIAGLAAVIFLLLSRLLTLKPETLTAVCALLSVITQFQFSGGQRMLFLRRTRAGEPDFAGENRTFVGPAQALLRHNKNGGLTSSGRSSAAEKGAKAGRLLLVPCVFLIFLLAETLPQLLSASSAALSGGSGRRMISLVILFVCLVIMIIHSARPKTRKESGPSWPRLISCAACAAAFLCLLSGQFEDVYYYACAAAMLLSSAVELIMINRAHNEYASRPVPFFGKEEGENE